jgi:hypothetical protein
MNYLNPYNWLPCLGHGRPKKGERERDRERGRRKKEEDREEGRSLCLFCLRFVVPAIRSNERWEKMELPSRKIK